MSKLYSDSYFSCTRLRSNKKQRLHVFALSCPAPVVHSFDACSKHTQLPMQRQPKLVQLDVTNALTEQGVASSAQVGHPIIKLSGDGVVFGGGTKGRLSAESTADQGRLGNAENDSKTAGDAWLEATSVSASGRSNRGEQGRNKSGPVLARMTFDKDNPADRHGGVPGL
jgi:hypothetical protein